MIHLSLLASVACSTPRPDDASETKPAENQVLFEQVRIERWEQDQLRYRARIETVRLDRDSGHMTGEIVSVDALDREAQIQARVTAPRMVSDLRSRQVRLEGGVRIVDREKRTLRSETLDYDSGADQMETSTPVEIEGENFRARGRRLYGQPRAGALEVEGPTTATVTSSRDAR